MKTGTDKAKATKILAIGITCCALLGVALAQGPEQVAWNILQAGAANSNSQQRVSAVTVLALITSNPKAVTMAEQALQDQNSDVRAAAATALGTLKAESAIPALQQALKDTDPAVVMSAAKSLVEMKNEDGYDTYYAVATGQAKSGSGLVATQEKALNQLLHNPKDLAGHRIRSLRRPRIWRLQDDSRQRVKRHRSEGDRSQDAGHGSRSAFGQGSGHRYSGSTMGNPVGSL